MYLIKNVDVAQKVNTITDLIGNLVASRFATGQSYNMVTSSLAMQISKLQATNLPNQVNIENAVVQMPTFCDLTTNANSITTTTTSSPYINPMDSYNCTNRIITLKVNILLNSEIKTESYLITKYLEYSITDGQFGPQREKRVVHWVLI